MAGNVSLSRDNCGVMMIASSECYKTEIINAERWETYYELGDALASEQRWAEAVDAIGKAILLNPGTFLVSL